VASLKLSIRKQTESTTFKHESLEAELNQSKKLVSDLQTQIVKYKQLYETELESKNKLNQVCQFLRDTVKQSEIDTFNLKEQIAELKKDHSIKVTHFEKSLMDKLLQVTVLSEDHQSKDTEIAELRQKLNEHLQEQMSMQEQIRATKQKQRENVRAIMSRSSRTSFSSEGSGEPSLSQAEPKKKGKLGF
jgi:chromosome segregation ATPase